MRTTLVLVDGFNLLWRAHFGFPTRIFDKESKDITGLFAFFALLRAELNKIGLPARVVVCFDGEHGAVSRKVSISSYKENRVEADLSPLAHLPLIKNGLEQVGLLWMEFDEFEADDVIASIARQAKTDSEVVILSRDRDFYQLIDDHISVWPSRRGRYITADHIFEKYGITPDQWPEFVAMVGDRADNISGVPGIGSKKAAQILSSFGSVLALLQGQGRADPALRLVIENKSQFQNFLAAIELQRDVPLKLEIDSIPLTESLRKAPEILTALKVL